MFDLIDPMTLIGKRVFCTSLKTKATYKKEELHNDEDIKMWVGTLKEITEYSFVLHDYYEVLSISKNRITSYKKPTSSGHYILSKWLQHNSSYNKPELLTIERNFYAGDPYVDENEEIEIDGV